MKYMVYLIIGFLVISYSSCVIKKNVRNRKTVEKEITIPVAELNNDPYNEVPIKEVKEKLLPNNELIPDPHRYFVIIGSFRNPENAKRYQVQINKDNFISEILKNESGLFRVSVMATNEIDEARNEIRRIRSSLPMYYDTWLLIQVK